MRIEGDQIVNAPWSEIEKIISDGADAQADLATCQAALRNSEWWRGAYRRGFNVATVMATIMGVIALLGWLR